MTHPSETDRYPTHVRLHRRPALEGWLPRNGMTTNGNQRK